MPQRAGSANALSVARHTNRDSHSSGFSSRTAADDCQQSGDREGIFVGESAYCRMHFTFAIQ